MSELGKGPAQATGQIPYEDEQDEDEEHESRKAPLNDKDLFSPDMLHDTDHGDDSSSGHSTGSFDSFGCDEADEDDRTEKVVHRNGEQSKSRRPQSGRGARSKNDKLRSFFGRSENSPTRFIDEDDYLETASRFSMSIMSLNSLPTCIREEPSGEEDSDYDEPTSPNTRRALRALNHTAVMSTPQAFRALEDEYASLTEKLEDLEDVAERRKIEKARLTKVLVSKQEEFMERKHYLDRLMAYMEMLDDQLTEQDSAAKNKHEERAIDRQRAKAWENLNKAVTKLEKIRMEGTELMKRLRKPPKVPNEEAKLQLYRERRRATVAELERKAKDLREEVSRLRGKQKASMGAPPGSTWIGQEITVDDDDGKDSIDSLTVHSLEQIK
jgi:hypothetical protein